VNDSDGARRELRRRLAIASAAAAAGGGSDRNRRRESVHHCGVVCDCEAQAAKQQLRGGTVRRPAAVGERIAAPAAAAAAGLAPQRR
jgi:hypothetical protein